MRPIRKFVTMFICVSMLLCALPLFSFAEGTESGDWQYEVLTDGNWQYEVMSNTTAAITGYTGSETDVTIPVDIQGYNVTSIGYYAFCDCTSLESVTIPDGVMSIRFYAFGGCTSLASITIPDGVTSIEDSAFYNTAYYNNESNWESDILYINNHLIETKDDISGNVEIRNGTKCIANAAFQGCSSLTSVTIPDSVESIGDFAFSYCESLENVEIGDNVKSIGHQTFYSCRSLKNINIPQSVESIGGYLFVDCFSLESITIPDNVTEIGEYNFYNNLYAETETPVDYESLLDGENIDYTKIIGKPYDIFIIYGEAGSAAEKYAKANSITFVPSLSESGYIDYIAGKTVADLKAALKYADLTVKSDSGANGDDSAPVCTGSVVSFTDDNGKKEYTVVVPSDVNCDGKVTAGDARQVLRAAAGLDIIEGIRLEAADINGDSQITAADARTILRKAAGLDKMIGGMGK